MGDGLDDRIRRVVQEELARVFGEPEDSDSRESTPAPVSPAEPAPGGLPWESIDPRIKLTYPTRMTAVMHKQLEYLVDHTPRCSIQKIITEALEREIRRRLGELGVG